MLLKNIRDSTFYLLKKSHLYEFLLRMLQSLTPDPLDYDKLTTHPLAVWHEILPPSGSLCLRLLFNVLIIFPCILSMLISSNITVPTGSFLMLTATSLF